MWARSWWLLAAVLLVVGGGAQAGPFSLSGDARWIALASRQNLDEAIGVARAHQWQFKDIRVMQAANGWYAVVAGPERVANPRAFKSNLLESGGVPPDLLFSKGDGYVAEVWKHAPVAKLAQAELKAARPETVRIGDLSVTLSVEPGEGGTDFVPAATGRRAGRTVFTIRLDAASQSEPNAELTALRLDPSSDAPQIVFTSFWGGAHCCTVTAFATFSGGAWRVVEGRTLDGGGYQFEDVDGDGALELLNVDNTFLYAFAPYSDSRAPVRVSRIVGDRIVDITRDPAIRRFNRQQLHRMEHEANLAPDAWRSNGFLAAWVATKALLGEADDAWSRMLQLYDRSSDWPLTECTVARVSGTCPDGKERSIDFPTALRAHLEEESYLTRTSRPPPVSENVAAARPAPVPTPPTPRLPEGGTSSGTGFYVTGDGYVVTNNHVVTGCSSIDVRPAAGPVLKARIAAQDGVNDLALLKVDHTPGKVAALRLGVRLGEPIAAFGFPLTSVLASSGNFTLGNITALAGIADDTRYLQISAPVQPGNSGGPLLDESGNVVGVVTSKLNALRTVAATGDLPQNVNFAIKASALAAFLESNRVTFGSQPATERLSPPDLADEANAISVLVRCE